MSAVLCLPACLCVSAAASRGQAPHGNASLALKNLTEQDEKSKKQELGASNLHTSEDIKISLDKMDVDERVKKIILHFSDIFGPLPPPGSVKKLVTMDLELREEFLKDRVRCRPYPASKDDMAEITRQIKECVEAGLV